MVFLADLFIKTKRFWEMNDFDSNNQQRFPCQSLKNFCGKGVIFRVFGIFLKNFSIIKEIIQTNVKIVDLQIYMASVIIFEYSGTFSEMYFFGFTSFDGQYNYLSKQNYKNQSDESQILEQQIIDEFQLWIIKNTNPNYISSEEGKFIKNGYILEQGDYYLSIIYCSEFILSIQDETFNRRITF